MVLFLDHSILTIAEPSGKGLPLPGMPSYQVSYPLNSENATPFSAFAVYLSCTARAALNTMGRNPTRIKSAGMLLLYMFITSVSHLRSREVFFVLREC
jgi:hypothetical protein